MTTNDAVRPVKDKDHDLDMMYMQAQMVWDYVMRVSPWSPSNDMLWADEVMTGISFLVDERLQNASSIAHLHARVEALTGELDSLKHEAEQKDKALAASYSRERAAERRAAMLKEALRIVESCAYAVCTSIDQRGHKWCESYLDQALPIVRRALTKHI